MRFGVLGPLEVWADERAVPIGRPQQRAPAAGRVCGSLLTARSLWMTADTNTTLRIVRAK